MTLSDVLQKRVQKEILELSESINEIVDSFRKLRNPLAESQEKVPRATEQLDKITEQTEAATQRMLDTVEKITTREEEVIKGLGEVKEKASENKAAEIISLTDTLIEKANTTCNDAYMIMDALQFQDITAQQVNHAVTLLEELEIKLGKVLTAFHGAEDSPKEAVPQKPKKERAFDPHADLYDKKTDQADIDSLFERNKSN